MLGLEHVTSRGSIMIEYYGRDIGVKIMPTGVNPDRFLEGFEWDDTLWRRGELLTQVLAVSTWWPSVQKDKPAQLKPANAQHS